jgi:nicotinate dehydrogenase subunit B
MGNSTNAEELSDMDAKVWVLDEHEFSRKSFLRAGGSLVIGMSVAGTVASGARAANDPGALSALHSGAVAGPPDPTQVDSWLQVNPDNSVTLFHGWAELGQGWPTAVRMIAAEELRLSM